MIHLHQRRAKVIAAVLAVAALAQFPVVGAASTLGVPAWITVTCGALVSLPFMGQLLRSPWDHRPRSRLHKYLVMWPFYTWWTFCLVFTAHAVAALSVAAVTPLPTPTALLVCFPLAGLWTLRALRPRPRVTRKSILIENLPQAFEGFRIVHLSDLHCGPFTPQARVAHWVRRANALKADLAVVTGDLITSGTDHVEDVAMALGGLKAPFGAFGCLGNHDYFGTDGIVGPALEAQGVRVLSNRGVLLRRPGGTLYLAGVDDNWSERDDLGRALRDRPARVPTVLLAHDPALFPPASQAGVDLVLSGHTHGGQFAVPWLVRRFNLARLMTPFSSGLYRLGRTTLFVNHGLGTSGPPIRLGARPELALITLVRAPHSAADSSANAAHTDLARQSSA